MKFEIEIKLRISGHPAEVRRALRQHGFRILKRRAFETNVLFDDRNLSLGAQGKLIRIRRVGRNNLLTYKGPSEQSKYKKRPEIEIDLGDADALEEILAQTGFDPAFRYEKFRTEYSKPPGTGKVMLDETPIGNFLEIEGSPAWIDRTARLLGHSRADYITHSYGHLFRLFCQEHGIHSRDMLFSVLPWGSKTRQTPEAHRTKKP